MHQLPPSSTEGDKEDPDAQRVHKTESLQLIHGDERNSDEYPVGDDREPLRRVHQEIGALFNPDRLGERVPDCGPASSERQ